MSTTKISKIDSLKLEYNAKTSEDLFGIDTPTDHQCSNIDAAVNSAKKINSLTQFSRYDDADSNEVLSDRLNDIEWESSDLPDNIEALRDMITSVREWGQGWKDTAKALIEHNNVDLSGYL